MTLVLLELMHDIDFSFDAIEPELGLFQLILENLVFSGDAEVGCAIVRWFVHRC
jgi:hypothetical protein